MGDALNQVVASQQDAQKYMTDHLGDTGFGQGNSNAYSNFQALKSKSSVVGDLLNPVMTGLDNAGNQTGNNQRDAAAASAANLLRQQNAAASSNQRTGEVNDQNLARSGADLALNQAIQRQALFQGVGGTILTGKGRAAMTRGGASTMTGPTLGAGTGKTLLGQ